MSAVIAGATFTIDLFLSGAWVDITCDVTSANWRWGASEAVGPLTEAEGGTLRVSLWDPDRDYDPDNPDSPLLGVLKVGLGFRVTVNGLPAWTGVLQTWAWDQDSSIADLNGLDPIGQLSIRMLPDRQALLPTAASSAAQAQYVMDLVEWPTAKRYFPNGAAGVVRGNHEVEGSALDALHWIRFAELGRLYPMRDGRIGWHDRAGPAPPAPSAVINCGGAGLTDMWRVMGLGRVRNHVVVSGGYIFGPVLPPDEYRSVATTVTFLQFTTTPGDPLPWDLWAYTILDALEHPPVLTMLGTIVPEGAEVAPIVCAEFGARWTVAEPGGSKVVQLLGERVTLAPGVLEVDAVTEDVAPTLPTAIVTAGAGSGAVRSFHSTYATARAGGSLSLLGTLNIGQTLQGGPAYQVDESFVWFNTSSIPVGATIVSAWFAAQFQPHVLSGGQTWQPLTIEVRSYPTGGWRPTLATADWVPGANLAASYPLRAKWDVPTAQGGFRVFEDAGSGLAGAIVKGGETQLLIVTSRTTTGTPPAGSAFEELTLSVPRLRVVYTL